jgi:murein DD-endopeptidase MepM/ murein hydrolase activator NlpD
MVVALHYVDSKQHPDGLAMMHHRRSGLAGAVVTALAVACTAAPVQPASTQLPPPSPAVPVPPTATPPKSLPTSALQPQPTSPEAMAFPSAVPTPTLPWRPPPYAVPWALIPTDHFYFARPIPSGEVNWPHPLYRYGNTFFGEESVHTGVDLGAAMGTPVLAAGPGEVVWAGYGLYRGIPDVTDPYGLAIAIRHDFGYQGQALFTIYAHLQSVMVWMGQRVTTGEQIGSVGNTGHASGPHLHFEVRLGENRYFASRNPELWMVPPEGWGVLAGSIDGTGGLPLPEQLLQIESVETGQRWEVYTYARETVHSDAAYGENFVISDLPAGTYRVQINFVGHAYIGYIDLQPGRTNLIHFRGRNGFVPAPTVTPENLNSPPYP